MIGSIAMSKAALSGITVVVCQNKPFCISNFLELHSSLGFSRQLCHSTKHIVNKRKNHFFEMKGDVGMSLHEKEGEQEDAYTETGDH